MRLSFKAPLSPAASPALIACLTLASVSARAEVVVLNNGQKIEGTVADKGETYEIKTKQGTRTVKKSEVKEILGAGGAPAAKPGNDAPAGAAKPKSLVEMSAAELLEAAQKAAEKDQITHARSCLDLLVKKFAESPEASVARKLLVTLPNAQGRLLLGFDEGPAGRLEPGGKEAEFVGTVQTTWVSDPKQFHSGEGAVHVVFNTAGGATFVRFDIPEQSFEKVKFISFWMNSESTMHKKRVMKLVLFSPPGFNFYDATLGSEVDAQTWKLVTVPIGKFKGEGGGTATDYMNGRPSIKRINGIGFLVPRDNVRDFIFDEVRVKE